MRVSKLKLIHFRSARQLDIDFEPGINILVGVNGAGKTTVLDALAIMLSWAAARIDSPGTGGKETRDIDIHNEKRFSWLEISCETELSSLPEITWRFTRIRGGWNPDPSDPLYKMNSITQLDEWTYEIRDQISQNNERVNIPLFVYYEVHRSVVDKPLKLENQHAYRLLDAYHGAFKTGTHFEDFFEWYRNREDIENERLRETGEFEEDSQLSVVKKAIKAFLPGISKISIKRNPPRMEAIINGDTIRVDQMSDGEKCLLALVGDLARRLAIANPVRDNPLHGEGIVLIDEIDLHLHPEWQRMVVTRLSKTFPNCQFILSTHSPQVFGEVEAKCIRRLSVVPIHGLVCDTPTQSLGLDSSEILEEWMEAKSRNQEITDKLTKIFERIDNEKYSEAKEQIQKLQKELNGSIPELVRAESLITMLEPSEAERSCE